MPVNETYNSVPVKIFGLQRTGTNLMASLLEKNFRAFSLSEKDTGWKHGPPHAALWQNAGDAARFVVCVRNPYAWLDSCYKYFRARHAVDLTMPAEFRMDPDISFDEFVVSPSYEFSSPAHRWNFLNRLWLLTLPRTRTIAVRQEDQVDCQLEVLEDIAQRLRLVRKDADLATIDHRVDVDGSFGGEFNRRYVRDCEYMFSYTASLLSWVSKVLDPGVLEMFDYSLEPFAFARRKVGRIDMIVRQGTTDGVEAAVACAQVRAAGERCLETPPSAAVVDIGAGVGAAAILMRQQWPGCRIFMSERCAETLRILRLNLPSARTVDAAQGANANEQPSLGGDDHIFVGRSLMCLMAAVKAFGRIDLLRIGSNESANDILQWCSSSGATQRIRLIVASLSARCGQTELMQHFGNTHDFVFYSNDLFEFCVGVRRA